MTVYTIMEHVAIGTVYSVVDNFTSETVLSVPVEMHGLHRGTSDIPRLQ